MTQEKYMALADFQTLWDSKLKPWINDQKASKSEVYTKTEIDAMKGPVYDETEHGFTFPTGAKVTYDTVNHGFVFG